MTSTRSKNNIKMVFCSQKCAYTVIGPLIEDGYAVMITRDAAGFWVVEATHAAAGVTFKSAAV